MVGRWILARPRLWRFFSLADLNAAIRALLDDLNDRPIRSWGTSRRALYDQLDRPAQSGGLVPSATRHAARASRCSINDWGPEPLNVEQRRDLLEIVDHRYDRGSPLIISQVPVSNGTR